ncbi:helix-turn-helix domain-containing protein [Fodinicola acaciae]|uniref:helix-turn-helix domain-containing protein n=1 Tax=Fodinicola acaciae TaxID=2681555 RepID=UPI001FEBD723|nr:helix-turn-helix domain-containing protein [Fodinicola acaciae]
MPRTSSHLTPMPDPTAGISPTDQVPRWTIDRITALGVTTDLMTAAEILGIGQTKAYELARTNQFPAAVLRFSRKYRVSVPSLLQAIGIEPAPPTTPSSSPAASSGLIVDTFQPRA